MSADVMPSETAVNTASEGCLTFQHRVRTATIRALSFINNLYNRDTVVRVPPVKGSCTEYLSQLKKLLTTCLISVLAENSSQSVGVDLPYAASVASVTKAWPDSCDCMNDDLRKGFEERVTKEKLDVSPDYLRYVDGITRRIFPKGVKMRYLKKRAARVTPPFTSTSVKSRRDGGSYASWHGRREAYLEQMEKPDIRHYSQFMVAKDAGKPRPLVRNDPSYLALRPLHTFLYDRLTEQPWLLRGPPTEQKFLNAGFTPGKKYLSADFTAATDNLSIEVAEQIIDTLASLSPPEVMPLLSEAKASLRPVVHMGPGKTLTPVVGQMMGNLLSFPLLCLQNYCAATWVSLSFGSPVPILVNGDDLVAQVPDGWVKLYREIAPALGMNLNEKKTSFTEHFLTVNSTYFTSNFRQVPFIRARALLTSDPRDLAEAVRTLTSPFLSTRSTLYPRLFRLIFCHFSPLIRSSGRTMHALGIKCPSRLYKRWCGNRTNPFPKPIREYERHRTGHYEAEKEIPKKPKNPMGLDLVKSQDPYGLADNKTVAREMVLAHWNGGVFVAPEKECLWRVKKEMRKGKTTRSRGRLSTKKMLEALQPEKREKTAWIPARFAECLAQTHIRTRMVERCVLWCDECGAEVAVNSRRWEPGNYEGLVTLCCRSPVSSDVTQRRYFVETVACDMCDIVAAARARRQMGESVRVCTAGRPWDPICGCRITAAANGETARCRPADHQWWFMLNRWDPPIRMT
jgi:hypothetical protein